MSKNALTIVGALTKATMTKINHNTCDRSSSTADKSFTTNVTQAAFGLVTDTLEAGRTYHFQADLGTVCTINGGITIEFGTPDTLTLTSIEYDVKAFSASGVAVSRGTTTAMNTKILDTKAAAYIGVQITGSFVVNAAGKFQLTAAQNTSHADTTTIYKGSTLRVFAEAADDAG